MQNRFICCLLALLIKSAAIFASTFARVPMATNPTDRAVFSDGITKLQASKALIEAGVENDSSRNLVWSYTESLCSQAILNLLTEQPTICLQGALQWDPAGAFTATSLLTSYPTVFLDSIIELPILTYVGYHNNNQCENFDGCAFVDDGETISGQYGYDCRYVCQ